MGQVVYSPALHSEIIKSNLRKNLKLNLPPVPLYFNKVRPQLGPINVCGNGPSLRTIFPIVAPIAALNGAWRSLAKHDVTPNYIIAHDPAPENVAWFEDAPRDAVYLLGSRMHPSVFELLKHHQVYLWHVTSQEEKELKCWPLISGGYVNPDGMRITGGHTIGCVALGLLAAMGYNHFDLYGYDSCWSMDGQHHATKQDWAIEPPSPFQVGEHMFLSSAWMVGQVEDIIKQLANDRPDYTIKVHDGGMLAAAIEHNTLEVLYDLDKAPGSFDFMHSLFNISHYMDEHNYCQLRVHFKPGSEQGFRPNEPIFVSHAGKTRMLNHVVRPMLEMFGAKEVAELKQPLEFSYSPQDTLYRYRATGYMPRFQPNYAARLWAWENFRDGPIVITLREATHWPQRNSDVYEWIRFARYIGKSKRVIFVRDTDCVGEGFEFETCDEASIDLHKRLALYRRASMNLFVQNGPAALAYYTKDIPYAVFLTEAPGYPCYNPIWLQRFFGIDPYGQLPWAEVARQRWVYADDNFETICKVYNELTS